MWTPKRVALLLFGLVLFVAAFVVYNRVLGGIDGLPPLPESCYPSSESPGPRRPIEPSTIEARLQQAFGNGCPELEWPYKIEIKARGMVLAADVIDFKDGRARLTPMHIALFSKSTEPGHFPEINTIEADEAYLKFDRDVNSFLEMAHRKLVEAELVRNVRVRNNRGTPEQNDDISLRVPTGIVHYEDTSNGNENTEGGQRIWTNEHVIMMDEHSNSEPTVVTAKGMVVYLARDPLQSAQARGSGSKAANQGSSSIDRIVLKEVVRMTLWLDPDSEAGFLDTHPTAKVETDAAPGPKPPVPQKDRSQIQIETDGSFEYDVAKDLAIFERGTQKGAFDEQVKVVRINGGTNLGKHDQLYCDRLRLKFHPKQATTKPKGSAQKQGSDREIEWVEATGNSVQILSDSEMFNAVGTFFRYVAKERKSILKSDSKEGVQALKDANEIRASELQLISDPAGSYMNALGPGEIRARDKHTDQTQKPMVARWQKSLESKKQGDRDVFILNGNASFEDPQTDPPRLLHGDIIQVWVDQAQPRAKGDKPSGSDGTASPEEHARRLSQVEVTHNVVCIAPEIKIDNTDHLLVKFKDPPPGTIDKSANGSGSGRSIPLFPTGPAPAGSANDPQGGPLPSLGLPPSHGSGSAPPAQPAKPPQKPIELSAHDVTATFLRFETRNELLTLVTQGNVHVHQDPAVKEDKGIDITGDFLTLTNKGDGHELHVAGDVALLRLNTIQIAGPQVTVDQVANHAEVQGGGFMVLESTSTLQGQPLPPQGDNAPPKSVPVRIYWQKNMTLDGREVRFNGSVSAEQEHSRLTCERLEVTLDRPISLKEGEKKDQTPAIQDVNCVQSVIAEDRVVDEKDQLIKLQRFGGPSLVIDNKEGKVNAGGRGWVRTFMQNADDTSIAPVPGSGARKDKGTDNEMKLTRVEYANSMFADRKKNLVWFRGDVEVFHLPTKDPDIELNKTKLPPGCFFMHCEQLLVLGRDEKSRRGQVMEGSGNVIVQSPEVFGRASRVLYDEEKDELTFVGENGTMASVTQIVPGVAPSMRKAMEAGTIKYHRKTGKLDMINIGGFQGGGTGK